MVRYLGLRGTKLNAAIGMIAGLDFLYVLANQEHLEVEYLVLLANRMLGYLAMISAVIFMSWRVFFSGGAAANACYRGVMGGLLTLNAFVDAFPEIDTSSPAYKALSPTQQNYNSTIQGELFLISRPLT
jgi:hypothetical protein